MPAPTVSAVSPKFGAVAGGGSVTITGADFDATATVRFGAVTATNVVFGSATSLTATIPAKGGTSVVDVIVTTSAGSSSAVAADQYSYVEVTGVSPSVGPATGRTVITLTGGFGPGTPLPTVTVGGTAATGVTWVNATTLTAVTPSHAEGGVAVSVDVGGVPGTLSAAFTYQTIAALTTAASNLAPAAGSTSPAAWQAYLDALQVLEAALTDGLSNASSPYAPSADAGTTTTAQGTARTNIASASTALAKLEDTEAAIPPANQVATGGLKNYQVTVPDFQEVTSPLPITYLADGTAAPALTNATSFLRLGSAPAPDDWSSTTFRNSVNLARLVGDPKVITAAQGIVVSNAAIGSASPADSSNADRAGATSSFGDGSGGTAITGGDGSTYGNAFGTQQDASYIPGFADDTRRRGASGSSTCPRTRISNTEVSNSTQNRQVETLKLLTKGGWWDHSDGNRVTTTSGDKIEVIQGNYKLVVLGRQSAPAPPAAGATDAEMNTYRAAVTSLAANAFVTDVSGGHFQEQYPSPTPCIKTVEYVQDPNGEWTLYQDNGLGNLVTKLKGRTVDLYQGPSRETYIGKEEYSPTDTSSGIDLNPDITSKTWAKSIKTYIGSAKTIVPEIFTYTYAGSIQSVTFSGGPIISTTDASVVVSHTGGIQITSINSAAANILSVNLASSIVTMNATIREHDLKLGEYFCYGTSTTHVTPNATTMDGAREVLNLTAHYMQGQRTQITAETTQIAAKLANVASVHQGVAQVFTTLAGVNNVLSTVNNLA